MKTIEMSVKKLQVIWNTLQKRSGDYRLKLSFLKPLTKNVIVISYAIFP